MKPDPNVCHVPQTMLGGGDAPGGDAAGPDDSDLPGSSNNLFF